MERKEEIINAARTYNDSVTLASPSNVIHFEAGAKLADKNPKSSWISVKNDLPCNHKELIETIGTITGVPALIATQNRVTLGIRIKSKDGKWYWCDNSTTLSPMIEEVMFWMPIPKLPKE